MSSNADYLMGVTDSEFERLTLQAAYLEPVTRRLIQQAGIGPGMRVLDIGCGVGDVSLLLAEVVGLSGKVVAIDREERVLARARSRARPPGHSEIEFVLTTDEDFGGFPPFDAAIGRYILFHQAIRPQWCAGRRRRCAQAAASRSRKWFCPSIRNCPGWSICGDGY